MLKLIINFISIYLINNNIENKIKNNKKNEKLYKEEVNREENFESISTAGPFSHILPSTNKILT